MTPEKHAANFAPSEVIDRYFRTVYRTKRRVNKIDSPLKSYREECGLSVPEAAKRLGLSPRTLLRYENNHRSIPRSVFIMLAAGCFQTYYEPDQFQRKLENIYSEADEPAPRAV